MLDGWYCRSMANEAAQAEEEQAMQESKYKKEYKALKSRFQHLVYENESFQLALRKAQKRLLQVTRDRSFLLDRLLLHEKLDHSTSESEDTESSEDEQPAVKVEQPKRRKADQIQFSTSKPVPAAKKKRPNPRPSNKQITQSIQQLQMPIATTLSDGHMTPEEVERHLQSRSFLDLVPERAPPTVPTEMFSNEPSSLDSESNDMIGELEMSPGNIEEEISIDYLPE
ncbi:hypothetical protein ABEB36_000760 [Hypothenemus hampei]|uniref:INO80 complex subunit E N-terminal domain-containing protein n=1 Tax=Hypothenemus hampei TaxID=57062 RepID=A0ABD1FCC3_HYPHA